MSAPVSPNKELSPPETNGESKNGVPVPETPGNGAVESGGGNEDCKVYKFRWVVLILFVMYSMSNAFQWIQFAIINGLVGQFYGISDGVVDMTSMIYMITYIPLIFPGMYFLDRYVSLTFLCCRNAQENGHGKAPEMRK